MPEIRRYRGKLINGKDWIFGHLVEQEYPEYHCYIITEFNAELDEDHTDIMDCRLAEVDPATVEQASGLEDRKHITIFEGDIVKLTPPDERHEVYVATPHDPNEDRILQVVFFDGMFAVDMRKWFKYGHGRVALGSYETERLEVVGNIHDNPDLLKGKPEGK